MVNKGKLISGIITFYFFVDLFYAGFGIMKPLDKKIYDMFKKNNIQEVRQTYIEVKKEIKKSIPIGYISWKARDEEFKTLESALERIEFYDSSGIPWKY
jgi:tRNA A37 N6-isopentenylltransferase MiaA